MSAIKTRSALSSGSNLPIGKECTNNTNYNAYLILKFKLDYVKNKNKTWHFLNSNKIIQNKFFFKSGFAIPKDAIINSNIYNLKF